MDFNRYACDYERQVEDAIGFAGVGHDFFLAAKARHLVALAGRAGVDAGSAAVLDVGCGVGALERFLDGRFGSLHGVDIAHEAVAVARSRVASGRFEVYDGKRLPFPDDSFDVVFAACVLHHVQPAEWGRFAHEMARVARPGGVAVLFEHNPIHPLTRIAVGRCEFDRGVVLLGRRTAARLLQAAGLAPLESRYVLPVPWSGKSWDRLERTLGRVPLGVQYYAAARKVPR